MKKEYKTVELSMLRPYPNNPRINDDAVDAVVKSIQQCGYIAPIIVDEENVILAGHTRLKALQKLGRETADIMIVSGLTVDQKRKYRLLDNKTDELSSWDFDLLADELDGLDFDDLDLDWGIDGEEEEEDSKYTDKTDVPQYEPDTSAPVNLDDLIDSSKAEKLMEDIENSNISDEEKEFLRKASCRHFNFNYRKIADYYAQASSEMQKLMEESALVIIDYNDAIKDGYSTLKEKIKECQ